MNKDTDNLKRDAEVAQFRFALIAPVIQGLYPDASATAYYKRVTASPLHLPNGSTVNYSYKTLEKWKSRYDHGGLDALMPCTRSDKGISRALNDDAIAEIYRIKKEHPRMNATQIHAYLIRASFIPATVSVDSVQRFIRHNDLKSAVATYGIPDKLYVDNGCSYSNEQLSMICVSLGVLLLHTRIRDGASKGKVERHFRTLKERWLYTIDISSVTSLVQFNGMLRDYMRSYNTTFHSGIDSTPLERFQNTKTHPRHPESPQWLEDCFYNRITRKVRKDSTITIDSVCYDVPMQFISAKVDIRYLPDDMTSAYILFEDKKFPIRQTNRNDNCHTKRNNLPTIDYSKAGGEF